MLKTNAPTKYTVPFAASGTKNAIPVTASPTAGLASYTTGFTSVNMEPIASGGVPPAGQDFNGIYFDATNAVLWKQSGFQYAFDGSWAGNANIGGYPAQSLLCRADGKGFWLNLNDNNTTNPDATSPSGWVAVRANMGVSSIAVSGATTTPDLSALGAPVLVITGALTANAALVLPLTAGASWIVENSTTGAYTLTVQGATGTGVQVATGNPSQVYTDGTNYYATTANVSGLYLPIGGNAVSASKLANARNFSISGLATAAAVAFDGTGNVVLNVTALAPTGAEINTGLGYTAANDAAVVHIGGTETITGSKTFTTSVAVSMGALGGSAGNTLTVLNPNCTSSNTDNLLTYAIRLATGTSWVSAAWRLQRNVDTTLMDFVQFGDGTGAEGLYFGTGQTVHTSVSSAGAWTFSQSMAITTSGSPSTLKIIDTGASGANLALQGNGATTPNKTIRAQGGSLEFVNSAYSAVVATLTDAGSFSASGSVTAGTNFLSSNVSVLLAPSGAGTVYLRPSGVGSSSGQATLISTGVLETNPTASVPGSGIGSFGFLASGSYGGGIGLLDGIYAWGMYDVSGVLHFGNSASGSASALTSRLTLDASGTLTANGNIITSGSITAGGNLTSGQNFVSSSANVVLATTGAGYAYLRPNGYGSTTGQLSVDSSGNVVASGSVTPGSDARIKTNVVPITNALATVRAALVGCEYDRLDQDMCHQAGYIAQKVKAHLPHLVHITETHGFEDFHSMDYNGAVPYLSAAILELEDIVKKQAETIAVRTAKLGL